MRIIIETIPHAQQRCNTCSDWQFLGDDLIIRVFETGNWRYNALVGLHEMVEALLCKHKRISQDVVDAWDMEHPELDDPGSAKGCPYRNSHLLAIHLESDLAIVLNVDWKEYEATLKGLWKTT